MYFRVRHRTTAGRALGYTVLLFAFAFIAAFYILRWGYRLFQRRKAARSVVAECD